MGGYVQRTVTTNSFNAKKQRAEMTFENMNRSELRAFKRKLAKGNKEQLELLEMINQYEKLKRDEEI